MKEIKFKAFIKWAKIILEVEIIDFSRKRIYCKTEIGKPNPCDFYNFDDVILLQYTGRKDKNNIEIYEGDKIKYSNNIENGIGIVECFFNTSNTHIRWIEQNTSSPSSFSSLDYFGCKSELEIIGHYENEELVN